MKNNKIFLLLLKNDIRQGILKRFWWFLVTVPIIIYLYMDISIMLKQNMPLNKDCITVADILAYYFEGMGIVKTKEDVAIPVIYISCIMIPFFISSYYPFNDFDERGKVIFTRTKKRSAWWFSKCIWNILSTLFYEVIMILTAVICCILSGKLSFSVSMEMSVTKNILPGNYKVWQYVMYIIIVPVMIIIALSLIQMTISMITQPVYGMICQIGLLTLSIFVYSPLLPHNYLMLKRSELTLEGGYTYMTGMILSIIISVAAVVAGKIYIEKKDIL